VFLILAAVLYAAETCWLTALTNSCMQCIQQHVQILADAAVSSQLCVHFHLMRWWHTTCSCSLVHVYCLVHYDTTDAPTANTLASRHQP